MSGFQSIAKKNSTQTILHSHQFKMLLASISVGVISGIIIAWVKLNLGMPGHKAFLWMTPVLIARLRGGCKIGTAAGGLSAALTTYCLGANLAGGLIGMPLIVLAGVILDCTVNFLEKNKSSFVVTLLALALAGAVANLVCLAKRMILPTGINPHFFLGASGPWIKLFSYAFFGLISGIVASTSVWLIKRKQQKPLRD